MANEALHTIWIAEDDEDDRLLIEDAFVESGFPIDRKYFNDGVELFEYLIGNEQQPTEISSFLPSLILLDLNMPRMDGPTTLAKLKADPVLGRMPVVVLTTSNAQDHVQQIYYAGGSSFITKPVSFDELSNIVKAIQQFWFVQSQLPNQFELAQSP